MAGRSSLRSGLSGLDPKAGQRRPKVGQRRDSRTGSAPLYLLFAIVIADAWQFTDPDLWGHIYFGRAVLTTRHIILHDSVSYSAFGQLYRNHEWLTEVILALLYSHFGVLGLKLWKLACVALTMGALAAGLNATGAAPAVRGNLLCLAGLALMPQMQFRPQLFTYLFSATVIALLARDTYRPRARLWPLVPMMAIWANLHGGFVVGIGMLGAYSGVAGLQDIVAGNGLRRTISLMTLTLFAVLATLLTPWGGKLWWMVARPLMVSNIRSVIADWTPLIPALVRQWSSNPYGVIFYVCVLGLIVASAITFALTPACDDLPLIVIAALMSVAAFDAARNMPLAVIACTVPLARHLNLAFANPSSGSPSNESAVSAGRGAGAGIAAVIPISLALLSGVLSLRLPQDDAYPVGAVGFMRNNHLSGNVLADFEWGQYLIWHLAPESKVFIDGRYDTVFPDVVISDYLRFYFNWPGGGEVLTAYPHDFVLITPRSPAYRLMNTRPEWKLIYSDRDSALYARNGTRAATITSSGASPSVDGRAYFP